MGIYISVSGIVHLMLNAFGSLKTDWQTLFRLAFRAIHQHELFHFGVDYFAGQWELLHGSPCHKPARALRDSAYGYNILEEECANTYMIRRIRSGGHGHNIATKTGLLREYIKKQPPGYRDGYNTSTGPFLERIGLLLRSYAAKNQAYNESRHTEVNLMQLFPGFPTVDWQLCPVHFINDGSLLSIPQDLVRFVSRISVEIEETPKFQKELSKLPKTVSKRWYSVKDRLRYSTLDHGLGFKPWKPGGAGVYSVRVTLKYRAHLHHEKNDDK
jgi:mRNA-degrading endonuclease RelE of RelBE toxin-antitoxin system